jgi:glycosyltransferase involved in cell wall biosynthesis
VVQSPAYKLLDLWRKWPLKRGVDGLLCLTKEAADSYEKVLGSSATIEQVDWGVDNKLYPGSRQPGEFFFSSGRTRRDYKTLFAAAKQVPDKFIVFAGQSQVAGLEIPENVELLTGDYSLVTLTDLIEKYYAHAIAVIICRLAGDASNDTSGLTCLLEAMAMCRPVIMTKTGCNMIDIESLGIGKFVPADDVQSLVSALQEILNQTTDERLAIGLRGRELVDTYYHSERHGADVADFVAGILSKAPGR